MFTQRKKTFIEFRESFYEKLEREVRLQDRENIKTLLSSVDDPKKYMMFVLKIDINLSREHLMILFERFEYQRLDLLLIMINSKRKFNQLLDDLPDILKLYKMNGELGYILCHLYNRIIKDKHVKNKPSRWLSFFDDDDDDDDEDEDKKIDKEKKKEEEKNKLNIEDEIKVLEVIKPILENDIVVFRPEEIDVLINCNATQTLQFMCDNGFNPAKHQNLKSHEDYKLMVEIRKEWYTPRKKIIQEATSLDNDVLSIILEY
jgi:hypothetical protein